MALIPYDGLTHIDQDHDLYWILEAAHCDRNRICSDANIQVLVVGYNLLALIQLTILYRKKEAS